ncbi:MAG TPA: serine/threonine-protein kinase [Planktothrix sp.]|jgi:serine/threonine protein kinase
MSQTEDPLKKLARACNKCGNLYAPSMAFCPLDGNKLSEDMVLTERTLLQVSQSDDANLTRTNAGANQPQQRGQSIGDGSNLIGTTIDDRYELAEIIGSGGMSIVYRARDIALRKMMAVKMLLPHMMLLPMALQRFQQEAQAASNLSHPNIVSVYSFGVSAGRAYIAMDYLEGVSLSTLLEENKHLPIDRALHIFRQVADALGQAHGRGVIHRDLKPSNIILVKNGADNDFVKIVDFGIAKLLNQDDPDAVRLTQTGEIFGSPIYMSPEQCKGQKLDIRADVYSLGCLMYESLVGIPPHTGSTSLEVLYKHTHEVPPPMSRNNVKIPQRLERIVFKTLAKEPSDRYPNMQALRKELTTFANERKLGIFATIKDQIELFWLKRRPKTPHEKAIAWVCGFLLLTVVSLGMYIFHLYWTAINSPASKVTLDWQETSGTIDVPESELQAAILKVPIIMNGQESPMEQVKLRFSNDGIFLRAGKYQQALDQIEQDYQFSLKVNGPEAFYTKLIEDSLAECHFRLGQLQDARLILDRIFPYARRMPLPPRLLAKDYFFYGDICRAQGNLMAAESAYDQAISLSNASNEQWGWSNDSHPAFNLTLPDRAPTEDFPVIVGRLGDIDFERKDYVEAEKMYSQIIHYCGSAADSTPDEITGSSRQRYLVDSVVNAALAHDRLAKTLSRLGSKQDALKNAATAVQLMDKAKGPFSVFTALVIRDYADILWTSGRYVDALMQQYRALWILARAE